MMKKTKYSIQLLLLSCVFTVHSQNLNLNYADSNGDILELPLLVDSNSSMSIDENGDVNINTSATKAEIGEDLNFQATGEKPEIGSVTIDYVSSNTQADISVSILKEAVYCKKSGSWGNQYLTQSPPTNYVTNVTGRASSESSNLLSCANTFGVLSNYEVSGISLTTTQVSVVTVRVNGNTGNINVDSGADVTVSWTATNSPDSCDFSVGDWPSGTSGTSGSFNVTNIQTDKSYSLTCTTTGIGTSNTSTATISVNGAGIPAYCNTDPDINPGNLVRDLNYTVFESETGLAWPAAETIKYLSLLKNQYLALKFTTPLNGSLNDSYRGSVFFKEAPISYGGQANGFTFAVSECPGDFRASLGKCYRAATDPTIFTWSTRDADTAATVCKLQKGRTYYLNYVHAINPPNLNSSTCPTPNARCGHILFSNGD